MCFFGALVAHKGAVVAHWCAVLAHEGAVVAHIVSSGGSLREQWWLIGSDTRL